MSIKTVKVATLLTSVLIIWIVVKIVVFIKQMPQCACSVPAQTLDRIMVLEKVIIAMGALSILYQLFTFNDPKISSPGYLVTSVFAFLIYAVFAYNVNDFRNSISKKCECADKWEKTAMYVQAIYYVVAISIVIIGALVLLSGGVINFASGPNRTIGIIAFAMIAIGAWILFGGKMNVFLDYAINMNKIESFSSMHAEDGKKESFSSIHAEDGKKESFDCGCNKDKKQWM